VTPADAGALDVLTAALAPLGFVCHRVPLQAPETVAVDNLYARLGTGAPYFCFAGHTDVVAPGDLRAWTADPFQGDILGEGPEARLVGRGAVDMKGAIAAFVAAVSALLVRDGPPRGSIGLLITGDEEGCSINGTRALLPWLAERGERPDVCLVGEPTNPERLGEAMKIGRRGSLNGRLVVEGVQGHAAYPHLADNPLPRLVRMLDSLIDCLLDEGTAHFPPSTLTLTSIDAGNAATNVIPAAASAAFNIRFNPLHTAESLEAWLRRRFDSVGGAYRLDLTLSGEAFLTEPGPFSALVAAAVARVTGLQPALTTTGGTSDARFLKDLCPVVEFGLVGRTMHKVDEAVAVADLSHLTDIYLTLLGDYFAGNGS
jgi:succinyl-diaminopimelate desuccinylase